KFLSLGNKIGLSFFYDSSGSSSARSTSMASMTKKMAVSVNSFAAKTVSDSEARSMNDFSASDVSVMGGVLDRTRRPRFVG
ncbi:MAG: hypothetical protein AAGC99_14495, partial [Pseudomonadota bacterium]